MREEDMALRMRGQPGGERSWRWPALAAVGAAVIFLVLAAPSGIGWWRAEERRQDAEEQRWITLSRQLAAQSINQLSESWDRD